MDEVAYACTNGHPAGTFPNSDHAGEQALPPTRFEWQVAVSAIERLSAAELREMRDWIDRRLSPDAPLEPEDELELSAREVEALRLIAWGYSNKEIAAQLEVSVKTVETYKARGFEKLDLRTRVQLVRYAVAHDWFGPEGADRTARETDSS